MVRVPPVVPEVQKVGDRGFMETFGTAVASLTPDGLNILLFQGCILENGAHLWALRRKVHSMPWGWRDSHCPDPALRSTCGHVLLMTSNIHTMHLHKQTVIRMIFLPAVSVINCQCSTHNIPPASCVISDKQWQSYVYLILHFYRLWLSQK